MNEPVPRPGARSDTRPDSGLPVALVAVDVSLPHLDRPFEYRVPGVLDQAARPGVRVRVRFAGRDLAGFVLDRRAAPEHPGTLASLRRVVSDEPVLVPGLLAVTRALADRYAGTLADVLRLAVPPRHATAERNLPLDPPAANPPDPPAPGPWAEYPAGEAFLRRLAAGETPAATWSALPPWGAPPSAPPAPPSDAGAGTPGGRHGASGRDWPTALAVAAVTAASAGRGFLIVVPDRRDVDRVDAAVRALAGPGLHVRLTADQGPQARYTAWLKVLRGHVRGVVGTRAAAFAPVADLGLVAWWDDGDDLHEEPHAPYPHVREVLAAQARIRGAALLAGGYARSTTLAQWVHDGTVREILPDPSLRRARAPRVRLAGEGRAAERDGAAARAHLPPAAWRVAHTALAHGPVLVQVPRRGYVPALACQDCRTPARCPHCQGPLALDRRDGEPLCQWCRRPVGTRFVCRECGGTRLRQSVVGARRTAEDLGRAFPGVPVTISGAGHVTDAVNGEPRLVIATPGAEPLPARGYAAALFLDAWAFLDRPALDAGQEAVRRWLAAAALVGVAGEVVLCGAPEQVTLAPVEALMRWAPEWLAERERTERAELTLPPSAWMAQLVGSRRAIEQVRGDAPWPPGALCSDPAAVETTAGPAHRMLVRVRPDQAADLNAVVRTLRATRSARKDPDPLAVRVGLVDAFS